MPRRRRFIESGALYEITIRTREGLPFICRLLIEILIKSALARTQRDLKVLLSHMIWMGNHAHILAVSRDAVEMTRFYGELQKRITDYMKRLLDLTHLDLWEGNISLIRIGDQAAAEERIAYFYANPSKAHLVDSIEQYPGYSSYRSFTDATESVRFRATEAVRWIRCPSIKALPSRTLTDAQDKFLTQRLLKTSNKTHMLRIYPNIWMHCFGVNGGKEVKAINARILARIRLLEDNARNERHEKGLRVLGPSRLAQEPIMRSHTPKKRSRRIFVIARDISIRIQYIEWMDQIGELCREIYHAWKRLDFSQEWPIGTFPPPRPPLANYLAA